MLAQLGAQHHANGAHDRPFPARQPGRAPQSSASTGRILPQGGHHHDQVVVRTLGRGSAGASGSRTTARRPGPASPSDTEPPWASAVDFTMARPSPAPSSPARLRASSSRAKRPKARSASSGAIPGPSSVTASTAHPPSARTDAHDPAGRVPDRVVQQVHQQPGQRVGVARHHARPGRLGPHRDPGRGVARRDRFAHRGQVGGRAPQVLPVQPGQQQQVLGQPGQPQRVGVHVARGLRPVQAVRVVQGHLELGADAGDRAAQLVRRVRDQVPLPLLGLGEPGEHVVQRDGERRAPRPGRAVPAGHAARRSASPRRRPGAARRSAAACTR